MLRMWIRGLAAAALGASATVGAALAQQPAQPAGVPAAGAPPRGQAPNRQPHHPGDMPGPIDSLQDLQDTGKMLFKLADLNNDGLISQKEAIDAANLLVGGFFFRADANGDGTVSQEEGRQARDSLLQQKPMLKSVLRAARESQNQNQGNRGQNNGNNPSMMLASLLDSNNDKSLQAAEVRKAVQTSVQSLYETADTNRDGQMSPEEVNAALLGMARSAAQAAFQAADADHNGMLSEQEFDKALAGPTHTLFRSIDSNGDGQISQEEARAARQAIITQVRMLQVPEPANSARNLIQSGQQPDQVSPVPNFGGGTTTRASSRTPVQPGAAPAPPAGNTAPPRQPQR